jgi:methionyl-tRNA formyltransferase
VTRIAFAGNRTVAAKCLNYLLETGVEPLALLVPPGDHAQHLRDLLDLPDDRVVVGRQFRDLAALEMLRELDLDYIIGIHFPYIVPDDVLGIPRIGVTNLHPSLLPFNRGWHTPTWALLDGTPAGVTLHFMDSGLDTGDIIAQAELEIRPDDTAHTLYSRLLDLEVDLFRESWPLLASGEPPRRRQSPDEGSGHNRADLAAVRHLDLESVERVADTVLRLRALTTSNPEEAAYFELGGKRYRVQVTITPDEGDQSDPQLATSDG